jgi:hypothetical protein
MGLRQCMILILLRTGDLVFTKAAGVNMLYLNSPEVVHNLLDKQAVITSDRPNFPMLGLLGSFVYIVQLIK